MKYTDPDGEWLIIDDIIAAVVGGAINVTVNAIQGNIHSWGQGFSLFGVGAVGGVASLYGSPLLGGAIMGAGNSIVNQGFGSNGTWNSDNINGQQVFFDGIMGGALGGASSYCGSFISPHIGKMVSGINSPVLQQAVAGGISSSAMGFTMTTALTLANNGGDIGGALDAGFNSALTGFGIGATTGAATGFRMAHQKNVNPFTGASKQAAQIETAKGGLNLFKWGAEQTSEQTGWKTGDYMLHLPDQGTPKLNWKANYGSLRMEMKLGNPIYDSYRTPKGSLIPTRGFLNAERFTLQSRGWIYNSNRGAWLPPFK
ncbi:MULTISPECIES: hypothetical protein [unclassified Dysgonomonas]|uniref:hypothetical protein n=1 Tax=unclassified Dysgonomonas TaxID=2630389 RepID=UPI0038B37024